MFTRLPRVVVIHSICRDISELIVLRSEGARQSDATMTLSHAGAFYTSDGTDNIPAETLVVRTTEPIFEKRRSSINAISDHSPIFHIIMGAAVNYLKIRVLVHCRSMRRAVLLLRTCMWRRQRTPELLYPHTATALLCSRFVPHRSLSQL
ncbi:hypothetical protein EDB83DRAFT_1360044 [Lactarius deliciosus]|nr:hypothetical protein EDB83DRAFT_1360044 [Lactarius deliciosus]